MRRLATMLAAAVLGTPVAAWAGAWPQPPGHWEAIEQFTYYQTQTQGFDSQGRPAGTGTYHQLEFSPYIEYGATDRLTIGIQPRVQEVWSSSAAGTKRSDGLAEFNLFARWTLATYAHDVFAVQGNAGLPGAATASNPEVAYRNAEYEARALWGHSFDFGGGMSAFTDLEAGYRARMGPDADEVHLDATAGFRPVARWLLLAQSFTTLGLRDNAPTGANYTITKLQISAVYSVTQNVAVQAGFYSELAGRNVSLGNAGLVALWLNF